MKTNVFLTSVIRQPVRAVLLAILIMVASFAFVARVTEYIIVSNAINDIENSYNSIGILSPLRHDDITTAHDVRQAADVVAQSPHAAFDDERIFVQGILDGITNRTVTTPVMTPAFEGIDIAAMEHWFLAQIRFTSASPRLNRIEHSTFNSHFVHVHFYIEEIIVGATDNLRAEEMHFVNAHGNTASISNRRSMRLLITEEEYEAMQAGIWNPFYGAEEGGTYLFRALVRSLPLRGEIWFLRPLLGDDGFIGENPDAARRDHFDDLVFFVDINDPNFDEIWEQIQPAMNLARDNHSSMLVTGTADMSLMPRFQDPIVGRIHSGRMLTYEDHENGNLVAVVHSNMTFQRGLTIGETFTITLRDNPRPAWIDEDSSNEWNLGIEGWWEPTAQGWWATTENYGGFREHELTLEVVGIYWGALSGRWNNFMHTEMFIPASLIPDGFGWDDSPLLASRYSFVLNSPADNEAFIAAHGEELRQLGFNARFLPNGYAAFANAANPIRASITVNLIIFSIVSVLILALVVLLYLKQWGKALAISRALGTPANNALKQLFSPAVIIWMPTMIVGAVVAWFFAISQSNSAMEALSDFAQQTAAQGFARNPLELIMVAAILAMATFGGLLLAGLSMARKPVLEQLQGTTARRGGTARRVAEGGDPYVPALGSLDIEFLPLPTKKSSARKAAFSHMTKHIVRSPIKSALMAVTTMFFVISLGWLNHTINTTEQELAYLWDNTIVRAEIIRDNEGTPPPTQDWFGYYYHAPITGRTIDVFMGSGFVGEMYKEALWHFSVLRSPEDLAQINYHIVNPMSTPWFATDLAVGVSNLSGFVQENTRTPMDDALGVLGEDILINFADGFDAYDFEFTTATNVIPIIVRRNFLQEHGYALGDVFTYSQFELDVQVIGYFEHGLSRAINRFGTSRSVVIMPLTALQNQSSNFYQIADEDSWAWRAIEGLTFMTAHMTIDPRMNREIDQLPGIVDGVLTQNRPLNSVPLELILHDAQLRNAVIPLEQNLSLLRIYIP